MRPKGRSISSCTATTWSRSTPSAPRAGLTARPDSFMKVWGSSTATRGPPGPVRPAVNRPPYFFLARGRSQRSAARFATSKPTLWRVRAYFSPGLPRPTISQSTLPPPRIAAEEPHGGATRSRRSRRRRSRPARPASAPSAGSSPSSPSGTSIGSPSSPISSVSSSISGSSTLVGTTTEAMVTSSRFSSRNSTPAGAGMASRVSVSPMSMWDTFDHDPLGNVGRQRLDAHLARRLVEHAALLDAGRLLGALELDRHLGVDLLVEADLEEVDVHDLVAHRVVLAVLEDRGDGLLAADLHVEQGRAVHQQVAQLARARPSARPGRCGWRRRARPARSRHGEAAGPRGTRARSAPRLPGMDGCRLPCGRPV